MCFVFMCFIVDTTPPVMIRVIDGFGDLDVDQQSFLKTIIGQVEAEDPLSGVWTYEWCVGTDEDPEGCSVMDWVSNYNETYVGAFDLEDVIEGETFKICGRATNVIGLRSEPMCSDGVLIGVAEAVVSKDKPTAVSFDSVDPNNAEGEATLGTVEIPAGAVEGETKFMATSKPIAGQDGNVDPNETAPPASNMKFGDYTFTMVAADDDGNPQHGYVFQKPIILTMQFKADQIFGDEGNADAMIPQLNLYDVETNAWINAKDSCDEPWEDVDWATNMYSVAVCHLTQFGLFYQDKPVGIVTRETDVNVFEEIIPENTTFVIPSYPSLATSISLSARESTDSDGTIKAYTWSVLSTPENAPTPTISDYLDCDDASYSGELAAFKPAMCSHIECEDVDYTLEDLSNISTEVCKERKNVFLYPSKSRVIAYTEAQTVTIGDLYTGEYKFSMTVYDNDDATDTQEIWIEINERPSVDVSDITYAFPGPFWPELTPLDGSGSSDDGTIASYKWEQVDGDSVVIVDSEKAIAGVEPFVGTYKFRLTVTDETDLVSSEELTLTVNPGSMPSPIIKNNVNYINNIVSIVVPPGGIFRYTIDGTMPSKTEGTLVTDGSISLTIPSTGIIEIKAIAFEETNISSVTTLTVANTKLSLPTLTINNMEGGKFLSISTSDPTMDSETGEIMDFLFTNDGSQPVPLGSIPLPENHSTEIIDSGAIIPITESGVTSVSVIARMDGFINSEVVSTNVEIESVEKPIITVEDITDAKTVSFSCPESTVDCMIRYTLDGTEPSLVDGSLVNSATLLTFEEVGDFTVKAIAYSIGKTCGEISTAQFSLSQLVNPTLDITKTLNGYEVHVNHPIALTAFYTHSTEDPTEDDMSAVDMVITYADIVNITGRLIVKSPGYVSSEIVTFSVSIGCGNGSFEPWLEECDDGNTTNGDGCDSTCKIETSMWDITYSEDGLTQNEPTLKCIPNEDNCITTDWVTDDWFKCDKECGSGSQDRDVHCINLISKSVVSNDYCSSSTRPTTQRQCNMFECPTYNWLSQPWDKCNCHTEKSSRSMICLSSFGFVSSTDRCGGLNTSDESMNTRDCSEAELEECNGTHWKYSDWSQCSANCGSGYATRTATCSTGTDADCQSSVGEAIIEKKCNTNICPSSHVTWIPSDFGECENIVNDDGTLSKIHQRTVTCQFMDSKEQVLDSLCSTLIKPTSEETCLSDVFCNDTNMCSFHGTCNIDEDICECNTGYSGTYCDQPVGCDNGTSDTNGKCCLGVLYGNDNSCCMGQLDRDGECCDGTLDACGVCNGSGVVVDISGFCCESTLDASGVCCDSGILDQCGVCNGDNSCQLELNVDLELPVYIEKSELLDNSPGAVDDFKSSFTAVIASILEIDSSRITTLNVADSLKDDILRDTTESEDVFASSSSSGRRRLGVDAQEFITATIAIRQHHEHESLAQAELIYRSKIAGSTVDDFILDTPIAGSVIESVCGDGICQDGEFCSSSYGDETCCIADCPLVRLDCPVPSAFSTVECGPSGTCLHASGICECFGHATGEDCSACEEGYFMTSTGLCSSIIPASCSDGILNGDEDGIDCGLTACGIECPSPASGGSSVVVIIGGLFVFALLIGGSVATWYYRSNQNGSTTSKKLTSVKSNDDSGNLMTLGLNENVDALKKRKNGGFNCSMDNVKRHNKGFTNVSGETVNPLLISGNSNKLLKKNPSTIRRGVRATPKTGAMVNPAKLKRRLNEVDSMK
eukprot:TRINITY_DN533_c0_g2_i2.p1 TRINITY_DN533_c0_g2~~TRINITY_DN533_c0_g2_i2.p1  ORF type:complete len:1739 (+),score=629.23 TRINITY_DN533_c0_g2_i2:197-5413(+)